MVNCNNQILTIIELAELLHVEPRTIQRYMRSRGLPYIKIGKRPLFLMPQIEVWLKNFMNSNDFEESIQKNTEKLNEIKSNYETLKRISYNKKMPRSKKLQKPRVILGESQA